MSATVFVHVSDSEPPRADVLTVDQRRFISLYCDGLTLHMPDYDAECAAFVRQLATVLLKVADILAPVEEETTA